MDRRWEADMHQAESRPMPLATRGGLVRERGSIPVAKIAIGAGAALAMAWCGLLAWAAGSLLARLL